MPSVEASAGACVIRAQCPVPTRPNLSAWVIRCPSVRGWAGYCSSILIRTEHTAEAAMADALLTSPLPADVGQAIRTVKAQLRGQIGDIAAVFAGAEEAMWAEATAVAADREAGRPVWPVVQFRDIAAGTVPAGMVEAIRRRGCVVVQDTFPRQRAEDWDAELASYAERNRLAETYRAIDDGVFAGLTAGKPSIYPIYWSKPQIEARQDGNMVAVRKFLNSFWKHQSEGRIWFNPDRDTAYPDRVRRRPPGANSAGLSPHTDSGSIER